MLRFFAGLPAVLLMVYGLVRPGNALTARKTQVGLWILSSGTWTSYGTLDGFIPDPYHNVLELYAFQKILALGVYGQVLGQPAYFSVPWQWTRKQTSSTSDNRIALGDGEFYLGQKLNMVEARMGLIFPMGYDRMDGNPWIGPGNVQATLGLALNPNITRYSHRWEVSAEAKLAYALDDAIAKSGSWGLYPSTKVSFRPSKPWKGGLEGLGYWKSYYWGHGVTFGQALLGSPGPNAQWSAGLVPSLFLEHYSSQDLAFGIKAGHSLWGYRDSASYHASIYLLYFP